MTRAPVGIDTPRLRLRPFAPADAAAHERLYADPEVTRYLARGPFLGAQIVERSRSALSRFAAHWERHGFGVWAVIDRATSEIIGQCGLNTLTEIPEVEVLYALARPAWGRGLAREAAGAALADGFGRVGLQRIVGLVHPDNRASQRVLEKLGLVHARDLPILGIDARYYEITRSTYLTAVAHGSPHLG
ncbi:MAG: GNAT family N-acetyltransferase [Candidatus Rokubacteria bacterium]|nr:GNAT family N-acetyltransferase [Candidatus Rokubacteria bacterium]